MTYNQIKSLEKYLNSVKAKTPEDVKFAKLHLILLKDEAIKRGENVKDELINIKIHYQGQLASAPTMANYLSIAAITISLIIGMFSVNSSLGDDISLLFSIVTFLVLVSLVILVISNVLIHKKSVIYTIIIQLIDEVLENQSK